jgi:hypothetical protein
VVREKAQETLAHIRKGVSDTPQLLPVKEIGNTEEQLEKFIEDNSFDSGISGDGSISAPTPLAMIPKIFAVLGEQAVGLRGKTLLDFGARDLRISLVAAHNYGMKATAVEKDEPTCEKARSIFKRAVKEGFVNKESLKMLLASDALDRDWKDFDIVYFYYTYPKDRSQAVELFRNRLAEKIANLGLRTTVAMLFTRPAVCCGWDKFSGAYEVFAHPIEIVSITDSVDVRYLQLYVSSKSMVNRK